MFLLQKKPNTHEIDLLVRSPPGRQEIQSLNLGIQTVSHFTIIVLWGLVFHDLCN